MTETEWTWRMDWCKKQGLPPADGDVWHRAGEAYSKKLGVIEESFREKEKTASFEILIARRGERKQFEGTIAEVEERLRLEAAQGSDFWVEMALSDLTEGRRRRISEMAWIIAR